MLDSPMISDVMPCRMWLAPAPSSSSRRPDCPCVSMKPGATTRPVASSGRGRRTRGEVADGRDAVALDADVGTHRRRARAVEHQAAADDQVELRRRRPAARQERRREHADQRRSPARDHASRTDRDWPSIRRGSSVANAAACCARIPAVPANPRRRSATMVETACPLDCPDGCSLAVSVEEGRVVKVDAGPASPTTGMFICGKVRRFTDHLYGDHRLLYPEIRDGAKGLGKFRRATWEEAMALIAERMQAARDEFGGESILPYSYGGSNGLITHLSTDADLWRALGTSRLARTVCAAPTGAAAQAMYGKMPGVAYEDYANARLIVVWGANPVRVRHPHRAVPEAGARGRRDPGRDRPARDAAGAPGRPAPAGPARHRPGPRPGHGARALRAGRRGPRVPRGARVRRRGSSAHAPSRGRSIAPARSPACRRPPSRSWWTSTRRHGRRWCAAAGASSATATAPKR